MSKGSKRKGWRAVERDYFHAFPKPKREKAEKAEQPVKPWLTMSDGEIDFQYVLLSKASRSLMKREAAKERLRLYAIEQIREI